MDELPVEECNEPKPVDPITPVADDSGAPAPGGPHQSGH